MMDFNKHCCYNCKYLKNTALDPYPYYGQWCKKLETYIMRDIMCTNDCELFAQCWTQEDSDKQNTCTSMTYEERVKYIINTLVRGLGDSLTQEEKDGAVERYTTELLDALPTWRPAAACYEKDRLPRIDHSLGRIVARDENGCYYINIKDLYQLPKITE